MLGRILVNLCTHYMHVQFRYRWCKNWKFWSDFLPLVMPLLVNLRVV